MVLLIDDDVNFHPLVAGAVTSVGRTLVAVRSGEEGLRRIAAEKPALVILDGLLPGMRGEDVARRLRSTHAAAELPIVFVTAFYRDLKSYRLLINECGVDAVLHKPLVADQLLNTLRQLLGPAAAAQDDETLVDVDGEDDEDLFPSEEQRAALLADYLSASREQAASMHAAFHSLGGSGDEEALRSLRLSAHRFRGSGASYGFPEISRLGGAIEDLIVAAGPGLLAPGAGRAKLDGLVSALGAKVRAAAGATPVMGRRGRGWRPKVLLIESEEAAAAFGADESLRICSAPDEALRTAIDERPDVVIVGLDEGRIEICSRLRGAGIGPVVVVSRDSSLDARLEAIRAGAVGIVARPPDLQGLFRVATEYARPRLGTRIVVAGSNRATLSLVAESLAPHGVAAEPAATAAELFAAVERRPPELFILDVGSFAEGADLLRVIRADLHTRWTPVLAIAGAGEGRAALVEAGAAVVLANPFLPDELAAAVMGQLSLRQGDEASRGRDPLTGLVDLPTLLRACENAVSLARREGRTLAIAGFDADLGALRESQGSLAADEVLAAFAARIRAAFRDSDVVARVGPDRIAVLLHSVTRADAERLVDRQLAELRSAEPRLPGYQATPVASLVSFPETASGAESLLETVDARLATALAGDAPAKAAGSR
ncbi:response regulator [Vulgatibacter incomptus]|uniref:DNA-binding response regulator ChvI n=1 Tax=Vulgatibacter incomptus TaxID=1391653 RepID=A0A0K1PFP5_9BACT|nr:response regulator [Vulgatibacter incomptus]AKU92231.1 DNA-binding response regulator ChvI [Vulgatibacter incomptus]